MNTRTEKWPGTNAIEDVIQYFREDFGPSFATREKHAEPFLELSNWIADLETDQPSATTSERLKSVLSSIRRILVGEMLLRVENPYPEAEQSPFGWTTTAYAIPAGEFQRRVRSLVCRVLGDQAQAMLEDDDMALGGTLKAAENMLFERVRSAAERTQ